MPELPPLAREATGWQLHRSSCLDTRTWTLALFLDLATPGADFCGLWRSQDTGKGSLPSIHPCLIVFCAPRLLPTRPGLHVRSATPTQLISLLITTACASTGAGCASFMPIYTTLNLRVLPRANPLLHKDNEALSRSARHIVKKLRAHNRPTVDWDASSVCYAAFHSYKHSSGSDKFYIGITRRNLPDRIPEHIFGGVRVFYNVGEDGDASFFVPLEIILVLSGIALEKVGKLQPVG